MNATPSFQLNGFRLRYARFRPNQRLTWPARTPGRLCVFLAGDMTKRSAGNETLLRENDIFYNPPEEKPQLAFGKSGAGTLTIELDSAPVELLGAIGFPVDRPFVFRSARCAAMARAILREMASVDTLTRIALDALVLQLFVELMRIKDRAPRLAPLWLKQVRESILRLADQPIRVGQLAKSAHVHPGHLSRSFRETYGESVKQLVWRTRVEQAAVLLRETDRPLVRIAAESGFCDQSHFCRVFRQVAGFTPSEFRRMSRLS